jgi:FSR family fosmidomycin resistance protein-like MFS transporter
MRLIIDSLFFSVASTHLMVDLLSGQVALLLAFLSRPLDLRNADIGLVAAGYTLCSSLSQPLFGWLADRSGSRWMTAGGVLWLACFLSAALLIPGRAALPVLALAGFGSAAFHPAAAMVANRRGHEYYAGRAATATSFFFLFGRTGSSLGPAVGGMLLEKFSTPGLLILTGLALPVALNAAIRLQSQAPTLFAAGHHRSQRQRPRELRAGWLALGAFALMAALRSWSQSNMITFAPKYFLDEGVSVGSVGLVSALFVSGSGAGMVLGGVLGDRFNKRTIILVAFLLAAPPLYLIPFAGTTIGMYVLIPLAGFLLGVPHSIVMVIAQSFIPDRMALASGLTLGFLFASGAIGGYLSGILADAAGLSILFLISTVIVVAAAALTTTLISRPAPQELIMREIE